MRIIILIVLISFTLESCGQSVITSNVEPATKAPDHVDIPVFNFDSLEPLLNTTTEKIHIINFWAMWCAPCVKELPVFEAYKKLNPNVEIILVSLDFIEDIDTKLKPFLKKNNITSTVVLLDDADANTWIDKIDPKWSGAIPFTIIFNNKNRSLHERSFVDVQDLENTIKKTIKHK